MKTSRKKLSLRALILLVVTLAIFATLAPIISPYLRVVFVFLFTYIILAESYDVFSGYTGYYNLGHGAFFGLGAYIFGVLVGGVRGGYSPVLTNPLPLPVAIIAAVVAAVAFAAAISVPYFRLRGAYFSVASLGLVLLVYYLANNLRAFTGGPEGLHLPGHGEMSSLEAYYLLLPAALASIVTNYLVSKSRLGLALISIREDEDVALEYGINTYRIKTLAIIISAAFSGYAGAAFAHAIGVVNPTGMLGLEIALAPVVMTLFGGMGSYIGALIGAVTLTVIQEALYTQIAYFHLFTYGVLLLIVGLLAPGGIVRLGVLKRVFKPPE
ncbi:MAG: branched-chain amino acid ABC transporter permease [Nitrososphaerales archaeon]